MHAQKALLPNQMIHANGLDQATQIHQVQIGTFSCQCFQLPIYTEKLWIPNHSVIYLFYLKASTMDASQYWPFAHDYSIWNATVTALQFWRADLKPHILSNTIDWVYAALFYSDFTQLIWNIPEEILFSCFVTILNDAFVTELVQEDEVYESGSESFNIPTPLSRAPRIYHVSRREEFSFDPGNFGPSPTTPEQCEWTSCHRYRCHSFTWHQLVFTSSNDESPVRHSECHH